MNKIINKYLIFNYFKIFLNTILVFFALGVLINLFEEIEFFKNLDESILLPVLLSLSFVPSLIFELLPFIVFLSAVFYFIRFRSNKDLLSTKVFGYSNLRIILILSTFILFIGIFFIVAINPITSSLSKFYETTKAKHSRDVNHLISINKNGLWIKEQIGDEFLIINGANLEEDKLFNITVYKLNKRNKMLKRIDAESADISSNPWIMKDVIINDFQTGKSDNFESYSFNTEKTLEKISTLYRNLNTVSFLDLINNYNLLIDRGYSKKTLNEKINKFISLPLNLFLMIVLASIFTIGSLNIKPNFYYVVTSILICIAIYYFKDLSAALGQTGKINLTLSIWMPLIVVGLFCSIGIIQINEK